jgi:phage gp46-like protein
MTDIRHVWSWDDALWMADWVIEPPDLAHGHDLETAVIISLFTDGLAASDDVLPDNTDDRRGWWGDTAPDPRDPIGSKLWLLSREKQTNDVRLRAEEYTRNALAWMLTDGVADQINVAAAWVDLGRLEVTVDIWRNGNLVLSRRYARFWLAEQQGGD